MTEPARDPDIRVLLADDHPVVRDGLRALLDSLDGFVVVAEAADGESAVREAVLNRPDVVLMDIRMPGLDGVAATRRIRTAVPSAAVLMLTMSDDDETVFSAVRAGARGYLLKGAGQDEISRGLRAVVAGEAIFSPGVAGRVLDYFSHRRPAADVPFPELTKREREVLELIGAGWRNAAIAAQLTVAPKTVANHVSAILTKLAVDSRSAAIILARDNGLGLR